MRRKPKHNEQTTRHSSIRHGGSNRSRYAADYSTTPCHAIRALWPDSAELPPYGLRRFSRRNHALSQRDPGPEASRQEQGSQSQPQAQPGDEMSQGKRRIYTDEELAAAVRKPLPAFCYSGPGARTWGQALDAAKRDAKREKATPEENPDPCTTPTP